MKNQAAMVTLVALLFAGEVADAATCLEPSAAPSGSCAYVTSFGGGDVCGITVPDGRVLGCVATGDKPHGLALSEDGARVYVSNEGSGSVSVIDAATMKVVSEVRVGRQPNQVALTPRGDQLWVLNNGDSTISVLDATGASPVRTLPAGRAPHVIAMSPRKGAAIVTSEGDGALDVFDLRTLERVSRTIVFGFPRVLAVDATGETAFLTVRWLNGALAVDLGGKGPFDRVALGEPRFAPEGKDAHGIALTHDGKILLLITQMTDELTFVDPRTLKPSGVVAVGHNPNWIGITADDRYAVVSTTDDDSASIVDLSSRQVVRAVRVGRQPKRLAVGSCPGAR
ncbi:MAG: hypothetical protein JNM38_26060 [Acidobacteria bacterium]|nr:hypothetical protein [Acidobacteriota bacterium]